MARKNMPKPNQPVTVQQFAAVQQELENLKRDTEGHTRDIVDCRRDIKDYRQEVIDAVKKRKLWTGFAVLVLAFLGYTSWTGIESVQKGLLQEAKKQLQKQVAVLYEEKHVAQVVDRVIRNDANDLIRKTTETQVAPIIDNLKRQQEEQSRILDTFKQDQVRYAQITNTSYQIIMAQAGDVQAFKNLAQIAAGTDLELSRAAKQVLQTVANTYFGLGTIITSSFPNDISDEKVTAYLSDDHHVLRAKAVYTVKKRKMYGQIPFLIGQIQKENSLDVWRAIENTLNELLAVNYNIINADAPSKYTEVWMQKKDSLLSGQQGTP